MKLDVLRKWHVQIPCRVCLCLYQERAPKYELDEINFDHHLALIDGGEHSVENIDPLCHEHHKPKSAHEHKENARAKRRKAKHEGKKVRKGRPLQSRPFDKTRTRKFSGKVVKRK